MMKFVQKWSLGWLGVYMYVRRSHTHTIVDYIMHKTLAQPEQCGQSKNFVNEYETTLSNVKYWHGTGRYQYSADGATKDTLQSVFSTGELSPGLDIFDITTGDMHSVSCSISRMYARVYADMHHFGGTQHGSRYGEPFVWGYYFIVSTALLAVYYMRLWFNIRKRHNAEREIRQNMMHLWMSKVTRDVHTSLKEFLVAGSDIKGNFGVLIGIKQLPSLAKISPYIAVYERRSSAVIAVEDWTHIEVPRAHIEAASKAIRAAGYVIPVFAIEDCEYYWSKKSFTTLLQK